MGNYHKCHKEGHQAHKFKTKTRRIQIFEGYCYNYKKYGHRVYECESKPNWSSNKQANVNHTNRSYNWDYNTRYSCHYCQEYGHISKNCIRTHFRSDYSRWLSQTTCFSYLKTGHISRNCPTRSKAPSSELNKGKGKVDVEEVKVHMNKTWKKKEDCNTSSSD